MKLTTATKGSTTHAVVLPQVTCIVRRVNLCPNACFCWKVILCDDLCPLDLGAVPRIKSLFPPECQAKK